MNNKSDVEIVGMVPASGHAKSSITLKVNGAEKRQEAYIPITLDESL